MRAVHADEREALALEPNGGGRAGICASAGLIGKQRDRTGGHRKDGADADDGPPTREGRGDREQGERAQNCPDGNQHAG